MNKTAPADTLHDVANLDEWCNFEWEISSEQTQTSDDFVLDKYSNHKYTVELNDEATETEDQYVDKNTTFYDDPHADKSQNGTQKFMSNAPVNSTTYNDTITTSNSAIDPWACEIDTSVTAATANINNTNNNTNSKATSYNDNYDNYDNYDVNSHDNSRDVSVTFTYSNKHSDHTSNVNYGINSLLNSGISTHNMGSILGHVSGNKRRRNTSRIGNSSGSGISSGLSQFEFHKNSFHSACVDDTFQVVHRRIRCVYCVTVAVQCIYLLLGLYYLFI
jgi:hypothetical protein